MTSHYPLRMRLMKRAPEIEDQELAVKTVLGLNKCPPSVIEDSRLGIRLTRERETRNTRTLLRTASAYVLKR